VYLSVFELIFFLGIENQAVVIKKAHNGCFPARAPQEIYDDIEKPVLNIFYHSNASYIF
jgi:hypothetical protein